MGAHLVIGGMSLWGLRSEEPGRLGAAELGGTAGAGMGGLCWGGIPDTGSCTDLLSVLGRWVGSWGGSRERGSLGGHEA